MATPFAERFLEQPLSLDVSPSGWMAVLDRGGRRLCLGREGRPPVTHAVGFAAARCRFRGENVVLLGREGELRTIGRDGKTISEARVGTGAVNLAVLRGGSVLVSYGRRGGQAHGITLERLGPTPLVYKDPLLLDATALAVESGGFWLAGTGSSAPAARALRMRPVASGLSERQVVALPAPPRAAAIGPDGALYVVLEPGESLVRVHDARSGSATRLPEPAHDLARQRRRLWSCGPRGLCDLTHLVPASGASRRVAQPRRSP
jgi:hypothetical protein